MQMIELEFKLERIQLFNLFSTTVVAKFISGYYLPEQKMLILFIDEKNAYIARDFVLEEEVFDANPYSEEEGIVSERHIELPFSMRSYPSGSHLLLLSKTRFITINVDDLDSLIAKIIQGQYWLKPIVRYYCLRYEREISQSIYSQLGQDFTPSECLNCPDCQEYKKPDRISTG